jgi:HSP20 family protein
MANIIPAHRFGFSQLPSLWDDSDSLWPLSGSVGTSGLSISEDATNVYVEAQVPGVSPSDVEVTFDQGMLWIKAQSSAEDAHNNRKYYRRSTSSFSYRVAIPLEVDENSEPEALCKNGVMKVTFKKKPEVQPKKIAVKTE